MKKLLFGLLIATVLSPAKADTLTGQLSLFGYVNPLDTAAGTIHFGGGLAAPTIATGSFASFVPDALVWQNTNTTIPLSQLGSGSDLFCGSNCLFVAAEGASKSAWLNVVSSTLTIDSTGFWLQGEGIVHFTGYDPVLAAFSFSGQSGVTTLSNLDLGFSVIAPPPSEAPLPAPLPATLPLFGSALAGLLWYLKLKGR